MFVSVALRDVISNATSPHKQLMWDHRITAQKSNHFISFKSNSILFLLATNLHKPIVSSRFYNSVVVQPFLVFSLLFKLSWLSARVGSVLKYWDLGGTMTPSSCSSANASLLFSYWAFIPLTMRLPMR